MSFLNPNKISKLESGIGDGIASIMSVCGGGMLLVSLATAGELPSLQDVSVVGSHEFVASIGGLVALLGVVLTIRHNNYFHNGGRLG